MGGPAPQGLARRPSYKAKATDEPVGCEACAYRCVFTALACSLVLAVIPRLAPWGSRPAMAALFCMVALLARGFHGLLCSSCLAATYGLWVSQLLLVFSGAALLVPGKATLTGAVAALVRGPRPLPSGPFSPARAL